jgi:hypothetical protein
MLRISNPARKMIGVSNVRGDCSTERSRKTDFLSHSSLKARLLYIDKSSS